MEADNSCGYIRIYKKAGRYRSGNSFNSGRLHEIFAYQCHCADRPRINPHSPVWLKKSNQHSGSNPYVWIQTSLPNH